MIEKLEILNKEDQFLDTANKPVIGKILIYKVDSNTLADLYTFTNNTFTVTTNPNYTDGTGRLSKDLFVETGIYLLKLYKYIGEIQPEADTDDNHWEFIRSSYKGILDNLTLEENSCSGITELKQINPEMKYVQVHGYYTNCDCEDRLYIWDENCVDSDDGGYIIKSSVSETGAWILLYNGEYIPSSYYGVYPGHEENMNSLMNYTAQVGSQLIKTAKGIYFIPGNYTASTVALSTSKKLLLDAGTTFTRKSITCNSLNVIGKNTAAICDFKVTSGTVHSSWFKTVENLIESGADEIIIDTQNYFSNNQISKHITLSDCKLIGYNDLGLTYNDINSYITLDEVTIIGGELFKGSDKLQFKNMTVTDTWFKESDRSTLDIGSILEQHKQQYENTNIVKINNFDNKDNWFKIKESLGENTFDLEGNELKSIEPKNASIIKNGIINSLKVPETGIVAFQLKNITCNSLECKNTSTTLYFEDSNIAFNKITDIIKIISKHSSIKNNTANKFNSKITEFDLTDTDFNIEVKFESISDEMSTKYIKGALFKAINSNLGSKLVGNNLDIENCTISNEIKVLPYYNGTTSSFELGSKVTGNKFISSSKIIYGLLDYTTDISVAEITGKLTLIGNQFIGTDLYGVYMPFWSDLANEKRYFIGTLEMTDNIGKCPQNIPTLMMSDFTETYEPETATVYKISTKTYRINELSNSIVGVKTLNKDYVCITSKGSTDISTDTIPGIIVNSYNYNLFGSSVDKGNCINGSDAFGYRIGCKSDYITDTTKYLNFIKIGPNTNTEL